MAAPPRTSLAWRNIAKGLQVRFVLFDARSMCRSADEMESAVHQRHRAGLRAAGLSGGASELRQSESLVAAGNVKEMLQREIREALRERGVNAVGKRWELTARLESLLAAERHEAQQHSQADEPTGGNDTKAPTATKPFTPRSSTPSSGPGSPELLRAKYAEKLRSRAGISLTSGGLVPASDRQNSPIPRNQRPENSWHMQPGLRTLLTYLDMRGMARGLLADEEKTTEEEVQEQAAHFVRSLQVPPFDLVLPPADAAAARLGETTAVHSACTAFDLPPQALMVVSDHPAVLQAARRYGSFACHFVKRIPGAPKALPSDFRADDCDGVKDAIEELNGITFRDPDTEIRSKYGVYAT